MPTYARNHQPVLKVVHDDNGHPKHMYYDDRKGHVIDLVEIMHISKFGWAYNAQDRLSTMTISFDAHVETEWETPTFKGIAGPYPVDVMHGETAPRELNDSEAAAEDATWD